MAQTSDVPTPCRQTTAPTQRPSCVSRSRVKVSSHRVMFGVCRRAAMMARMTSKPVASPRAWTMRRWLWPPSRVRASSPSFQVELRAEADQVVDLLRGLADDQLDDVAVAQAGAGDERVLDVVLEAVLGGQHAGDAALGVGAVALVDAVLGDDEHVEVGRDFEGGAEPGDAGADDEDVGEQVKACAGVERDEIAARGHAA